MTLTTERILIAAFLALAVPGLGRAEDSATEKRPQALLVPHTKFSQDCGQCHVAKRWDVIKPDFHFDHGKETGYPLNDAHARAKCVQCHNDRGPVKVYSVRGCGGCHPDPHKNTLGRDCRRCHNEITWRPNNMIVEHAKTSFPLSGAHLAAQCEQCHLRASVGDYKGAQILCYSCHQLDYQKGANHVRFNYPRTCDDCHKTSSFSGARFNHGFLSNVADCYICHQVDHQRAANHTAFIFPHTCGDCHNTVSFTNARFNHNFLGNTTACYSCHAANYQSAARHVGVKPTTCYNCHVTSTWLTAPAAQSPGVRH